MKLTAQHPYSATPDVVWAMLTDRAFRDEVCRQTGAISCDVAISADDSGGTVSITRVLPSVASETMRKLVGDTVTVVENETWGPADGAGLRTATIRLEVRGQPASMQGSRTLSPAGATSVIDIDGDLKVSIPFLGGRLEKEVGKAVSAGLAKEHEVGQDYLARR